MLIQVKMRYFTALGDSTKDLHKYILKGTMMNTPFWVSPCKKEIMYSTHLLDSLVTNRWQIGLQTSYVSGFGTSHKKGTTLKCCHCSYSEASTLILIPFFGVMHSFDLDSFCNDNKYTYENIFDNIHDNIHDTIYTWQYLCQYATVIDCMHLWLSTCPKTKDLVCAFVNSCLHQTLNVWRDTLCIDRHRCFSNRCAIVLVYRHRHCNNICAHATTYISYAPIFTFQHPLQSHSL